MTNEQLAQLIQTQTKPVQDNSKWIMGIIAAVAIWWITAQGDKTDSASTNTATLTVQMTAIQSDLTSVKEDIRQLRNDQANARVDPFTGSDGQALENRVMSKVESVYAEVRSNATAVRDLKFQIESTPAK